MRDANLDTIERLQIGAKAIGKFLLIRILYPYPVTDRNPELYRHVKAVSPFGGARSKVFRLAIHLRRASRL